MSRRFSRKPKQESVSKSAKPIPADQYMMATLKRYQDDADALRKELAGRTDEESMRRLYATQGALSATAYLAGLMRILASKHKGQFPVFTAEQYADAGSEVNKIMQGLIEDMTKGVDGGE